MSSNDLWGSFLSRVYGGLGSERAYSALGSERRRLWAVEAVRLLSGRHLLLRFDTSFLCNLSRTTGRPTSSATWTWSGPTASPWWASSATR